MRRLLNNPCKSTFVSSKLMLSFDIYLEIHKHFIGLKNKCLKLSSLLNYFKETIEISSRRFPHFYKDVYNIFKSSVLKH